MKKKILIVIGIITVLYLFSFIDGLFVSKEWKQARDKVDSYLTERYGESFKYEAPKKSVDTQGDGKTYNGYYVKTKSKKYPKIETFVNYVETDERIKECWQSVKYAYLLNKDLDKEIKYSHKLEVSSLNWEYEDSKVYDNYEDYYNSGTNDKTKIYLYIEDKNIDSDIKNVLEELVNKTPSNMKGKILLQAVHFDLSTPSFNSISTQYIFGNWDNIEVEFTNNKIDWENIKSNHENNNKIVNNLK